MLLIASLVALIIIGGCIISIYIPYKRKKLFQKIAKSTMRELTLLESKESSHFEYFLALDVLVDKMVRQSGYSESFGTNLKKNPPILAGYINEVWRFHKIRNSLAHGGELQVSLREQCTNYARLIKNICNEYTS
ncbi:MAG: hypothetical protein U0518_00465 [Candidatus Gracilibacteria bacterium]